MELYENYQDTRPVNTSKKSILKFLSIFILLVCDTLIVYKYTQVAQDIHQLQTSSSDYVNESKRFKFHIPTGWSAEFPSSKDKETLVVLQENEVGTKHREIKVTLSERQPTNFPQGITDNNQDYINRIQYSVIPTTSPTGSSVIYSTTNMVLKYLSFEISPAQDQSDYEILRQMLLSLTFMPAIVDQPLLDTLSAYSGPITSNMPYKGLIFKELDIRHQVPLTSQMDVTDYFQDKAVYEGYTFEATKGEYYEIYIDEDSADNPGSFIDTELYGLEQPPYKMGARMGWSVQHTGRYFLVLVGKDNYGSKVIGANGKMSSKYGIYTLHVSRGN